MDNEQKYKNALEKVKELLDSAKNQGHIIVRVEDIENAFPEIQESEENKIRKVLLDYFQAYKEQKECGITTFYGIPIDNILAWLEKQGEPEADQCSNCINDKGCATCVNGNMKETIKSKFNEGDYIVPYNITPLEIWKVVNIDKDGYYNIQPITNIINTEDDETYRVPGFIIEKDYRLWTIADAKDGDVLFTSSTASHETFIFKNIDEKGNAKCYFAYDSEDGFREGKYHFIGRATDCKPATKEQRDLFFAKMKEAGWERIVKIKN